MRPALLLILCLSGCATPLSPACLRVASGDGCPECADGYVTCTLGDVSATELSCFGCQAETALFEALCTQGSMASNTELDSRVCEPVDAP